MKSKKQSGQVLFGTAAALVVLAGFAGLAIDMGTLRYQRRLQQTAADGAAIAGAQNLAFGFGVLGPGQAAATQNGFTDNNSGGGCVGGSVGCISVSVVAGPAIGPHAGNPLYVEAIVAAVQPTYFMKIFGVNKELVSARAVATNTNGGDKSSCLYTLGKPTAAIEGINAQGHAHLIAPKCGIADNGNLDTTGNAYTIQSRTIAVAGACTGNDCANPNVTCTAFANNTCPPLGGAPITQDPLTGIVPPTQPAASPSCPDLACNWSSPDSNSTGGAPITIQPGTYSSILIGKNSNVIMAPGVYYINGSGGLGFNGGGTLSDAGNPGVMIYFTGSATLNKVNGNGGVPPVVTLIPMTDAQSTTFTGSSAYGGILFYQDPNDTATPWIGGDNSSTYDGTVYFPTVTLTFYGNSNYSFNGTVIADAVSINGNPTVNFGTSPAGVPVPDALTIPILVE
jgi:hypothetical protein